MACRRRVDDDDLVVGGFDDVGKGVEDGNFLGARRTQVFFDIGQVRRAQAVGFGLVQDFLLVMLQFCRFVDMTQGQVVRLADDILQMGCRVCRRQVNAMAAAGQAQGNGCSDSRLADAAFAHGEDDLAMTAFQVVDDGLQGWTVPASVPSPLPSLPL